MGTLFFSIVVCINSQSYDFLSKWTLGYRDIYFRLTCLCETAAVKPYIRRLEPAKETAGKDSRDQGIKRVEQDHLLSKNRGKGRNFNLR
jgi:hypothetical protein